RGHRIRPSGPSSSRRKDGSSLTGFRQASVLRSSRDDSFGVDCLQSAVEDGYHSFLPHLRRIGDSSLDASSDRCPALFGRSVVNAENPLTHYHFPFHVGEHEIDRATGAIEGRPVIS